MSRRPEPCQQLRQSSRDPTPAGGRQTLARLACWLAEVSAEAQLVEAAPDAETLRKGADPPLPRRSSTQVGGATAS
jgi:hypothetical protein